jgi:hypothetical protein
MNAKLVIAQLNDVYARTIQTGLSVKQTFPANRSYPGGTSTIGDLTTTAGSLKDIPYAQIYEELETNEAYHIKVPDGGLLIFQYKFSNSVLIKHRLAYFPSPVLPTFEEAPHLYEQDELFGDIVVNRLVRFPIRFDFDTKHYREVDHPKSHLTLGQFDGCRIPVATPVLPNTFLMFLLRNFYNRFYRRNMNKFNRRMQTMLLSDTITDLERKISHVVM